jgi:DNA polymerase-3 subunit gamma/tau
MLTTEAFNALLKTLEEPPAHVIFVLATTEAHKVPETIVSRTQRFNFKPIGMTDLVAHLRDIATKENMTIDDEALQLLAVASRGGFRDAISLLDQVGHSTSEPITVTIVRELLGWSSLEAINTITKAIAENQPAKALEVLDQVLADGAQVSQIVAQLIARWREIMLVAAGASKSSDEAAQAIAGSIDAVRIVEVVRTLAEVTKSALPALALETAIVKLSLPHQPTAQAPIASVQSAPQPVAATAPAPIQEKTHTRPATHAAAKPTTTAPSSELWKKVLILIKEKNNSLYALLCTCTNEFNGDQVVLTCRFTFHRDRLNEPKNREIIETCLSKAYGRTMTIICQLEDMRKEKANTETELVSSALEILGGEVVDG